MAAAEKRYDYNGPMTAAIIIAALLMLLFASVVFIQLGDFLFIIFFSSAFIAFWRSSSANTNFS
jgi:hypothetical protein